MTVFEQAQAFAAMMVCGAGLGGAYDVLGLFRRGAMTHVLDLFFGVLAAAGMIGAALLLRVDAFRLYAFAGVIAGGALYRMTIGTIVRKVSGFVRKNVKKAEICPKT